MILASWASGTDAGRVGALEMLAEVIPPSYQAASQCSHSMHPCPGGLAGFARFMAKIYENQPLYGVLIA